MGMLCLLPLFLALICCPHCLWGRYVCSHCLWGFMFAHIVFGVFCLIRLVVGVLCLITFFLGGGMLCCPNRLLGCYVSSIVCGGVIFDPIVCGSVMLVPLFVFFYVSSIVCGGVMVAPIVCGGVIFGHYCNVVGSVMSMFAIILLRNISNESVLANSVESDLGYTSKALLS